MSHRRTYQEVLREVMDFEPSPCREWTRWDHFVFKVTGRVSRRIHDDRMEKMWQDDHRLQLLKAELDLSPRGAAAFGDAGHPSPAPMSNNERDTTVPDGARSAAPPSREETS